MRYLSYNWPGLDVAAVCQAQTVAANAPFLLNGTLAVPGSIPLSFIKKGFIRNVSLTSQENRTAITFTVTGLQNGVIITEQIVGPNGGGGGGHPPVTVEGILTYDVITSITSNTDLDAGNDVTIGTGSIGYFPLIIVDNLMDTGMLNYALQVTLDQTPGVTYTIFYTLENVVNNGVTFDNGTTHFPNLQRNFVDFSGPVITTDIFQDYLTANSFLIQITHLTDVSNTATLTYIQIQ